MRIVSNESKIMSDILHDINRSKQCKRDKPVVLKVVKAVIDIMKKSIHY